MIIIMLFFVIDFVAGFSGIKFLLYTVSILEYKTIYNELKVRTVR